MGVVGDASVRVVLYAASAIDAESVLGELRRAGYEPECEHVESEAAAIRALAEPDSPVVLIRGSDTTGTISRLVATISHDLRNLVLMPLVMQVELAQRMIADHHPDRAREILDRLVDLARQGEAAVERLRQFGRQRAAAPLRLRPVRPDWLAEQAADIGRLHIRPRPGRNIKIEVMLGQSVPIDVDPHEVVAALVNLVVNGIEAIDGGGGTVRIASGNDDKGVWIEVADNGPGMPPSVRDRLFEPYFTTKGDDGTGLGLGIVDACMRRHGGTVEVITAPRSGTKFRLRFPPSGLTHT